MDDSERLRMSKKRDHKIMITEEAIRKVPFIRYREIPEDEYKIIHELAKQVLQLSKEADTLSYHLIMSSKECMVVSMHNHPSVSLISVADMRFFLQYGSIRLLVIVTNLGSISYMVKSRRYDYVKAVRLLNQTIQLHI